MEIAGILGFVIAFVVTFVLCVLGMACLCGLVALILVLLSKNKKKAEEERGAENA